jgi:hypothetical protein
MGSSVLIDGQKPLLFCQSMHPFYWSSKDTDVSIQQAKDINAIGVDACGWKKK